MRGAATVMAELAACGWAALPDVILHGIFACLPADGRFCAASVCRGWHAASTAPSLWKHLNFTPSNAHLRISHRVAERICLARCRGVLETLDVSALDEVQSKFEYVARASAGTLRHLLLPRGNGLLFGAPPLNELVRLAGRLPVLQSLHAACEVKSWREAIEALNAPPPLHLHGLNVWLPSMGGYQDHHLDLWPEFCRALSQKRLSTLSLVNADMHEGGNTEQLADALGAARVRRLVLFEVGTYAPFNPIRSADGVANNLRRGFVASLVRAAPLRHLHIKATQFTNNRTEGYFCVEAATALAPALRAATSLRAFVCEDVMLFSAIPVALMILGACTAHPSLHTLDLCNDPAWKADIPEEQALPLAVALESLIMPPGTRLRVLFLCGNKLGDDVLGPLVDALPRAPYVRIVALEDCGLTPAFCEHRLLPAARASPRLAQLHVVDDPDDNRTSHPAAAEAQDMVSARYPRYFPFSTPSPWQDEDELTEAEEERVARLFEQLPARRRRHAS